MAKSWYELRELGSLSLPKSVLSSSTPLLEFENKRLSAKTDSSTGSACNFNACTPASSVSATLNPMSNVGLDKEGSLSVQLRGLTVCDDHCLSARADSFSSSPDTVMNKGAIAFLELVEQAIAKSSQMGFDQLVIEMMDLEVGERVATSSQIPEVLKRKGWDVDQVSSVWSVGPSVPQCRQWNVDVVKQLGGSSVVADVWHTLKSRN